MMTETDRLKFLVGQGSIRLINIIAIPRSVSTAFSRALNESNSLSIFINEPFNRHNRSLEVAAGNILKVIDKKKLSNKPLNVIIKNMSTYISKQAFDDLLKMSCCLVWIVRDPLLQIGSLVTRMANDIVVENGSSEITDESSAQYYETVSKQLECSDISINFSRTGWESVGTLFDRMGDYKKYIVIDGGKFVQNPKEILTKTCNVAGLEYKDKMTSGWKNDYVNLNTGTSRFQTSENAWTCHAARSKGITTSTRKPLQLDALPVSIRNHLTNVAIPLHAQLTKSKNTGNLESPVVT